jgi:hypothetical protein
MDEPALRSLISSLEQQLGTFEWWLYFWTVLVIVGCAGELFFVFHEYLDERKTWFSARTLGSLALPEKPSGLVFILEVLSVALVVVGIAGELYIDWKSGDLQTQLRNANGSLILLLEKESGDAVTNAKLAKATADAVGREAQEAESKIESVSKRASDLDAGLRETQYAFSMRNLQTLAIRDQLIERLKRFKGKTVFVRSYRYMGDVDGHRVCQMVLDLARNAGMNPVDQCSTLLPSTQPATGITVCGPDDQEMLSLSMALTPLDGGTTCPWGNAPHSPDLTISVGAKSLMGIGESFQTEDASKRAAAMKKEQARRKKP